MGGERRSMANYDGCEQAVNSGLSGEEELVVEESVHGIDCTSINAILKNEATSIVCQQPKSESIWFNTSPMSDYTAYFKAEDDILRIEREWDWVVKRKNMFLACLGTITIIFQIVEIEI